VGLLATAVLVFGTLAGAQTVDLVAGTLNGVSLCAMRVDDLADQLGRPTAVAPERLIGSYTLGPNVDYHPLGLSASFHGSDRPEQTLLSLRFNMLELWDESAGRSFEPARFAFVSGLTSDWRTHDVLAAFASVGPHEITPAMAFAAYQESELQRVILGPREVGDFRYVIEFLVDDRFVRLHHEPVTRYVEFVTLACGYAASSTPAP
jgi:hypothetical protein